MPDPAELSEDAVTVVIPTHNRRALLMRTLDSVLRQEDVAVEVLVVDDGGSDGSDRAIQALGLPNVRVIRHERSRGVSTARNAGLVAAQTRYVAFVVDDGLWAPGQLRSQLSALSQTDGARWVCSGAIHVDDELTVLLRAEPPASGDVAKALLGQNVIPGGGSGVLVETALARDVGGFDEQISVMADWDFWIRLSMCAPLATAPDALVAYYVHQDSMFYDPAAVLRELFYLERKHAAALHDYVKWDHFEWLAMTIRMGRALGDRRAVLNVAITALRNLGPVTLLALFARWVVRRTSRPREAAVNAPARGDTQDDWLRFYAWWKPS